MVEHDLSKRSKEADSNPPPRSFLCPVKTVGRVVDGRVTPSLYHCGGMWFSAVASGDTTFSIVALDTLHTVFSASIDTGRIESLASKDDVTFVHCTTGHIAALERGDTLWQVAGAEVPAASVKMLVFDEIMIVAYKSGTVHVRSTKDGSIINALATGDANPESVSLTDVIHPNTFKNKILIGYSDGHLELWNVKTASRIHLFRPFRPAAVNCIAQSPNVDVGCVGMADGQVVVFNMKTEEELGWIDTGSPVCSVQFRFDSPPEDVQLMVADAKGALAIWSIRERAHPIGKLGAAHNGSIVMASFLTGQPIILSFGRQDNSMKEWIVESEGREMRLLRSREGPHHPITSIQFSAPSQPELVCTSGDEAIVSLSLGLDTKIRRLKTHIPASTNGIVVPGAYKVAQVSVFTANVLGWDDGIALVEGRPFARAINKRRNADGQHLFISADHQPLVAGRVSQCGHYCVVASRAGLVSVFSMQSGLLKTSFQVPTAGIMVEVGFDSVSRRVVALTASGALVVYRIDKKAVVHSHQFDFSVKKALFKHESDCLYLLSDDYCLLVYDLDSLRMARRLEPHEGLVSDFAVTPDSKWLLTCSPSCITLWDMVSGLPVGQHKTDASKVIKCIAVSADGEFVATVCHGCNYAQLWWFLPHSALLAPNHFSVSSVSAGQSEQELMLAFSQGSVGKLNSFINWQRLREQNKPKVPVKKSSSAPFFLSELAAGKKTTEGEMEQEQEQKAKGDDAEPRGRTSELSAGSSEHIRQFLLEAPANQIHQELSLASGESVDRIVGALQAISQSPNHFDRALALVSILVENTAVSDGKHWRAIQDTADRLFASWAACNECLHSSLNVIRFAKGPHQH